MTITEFNPRVAFKDERDGLPLKYGAVMIWEHDTTIMAISWSDPRLVEHANCNPVPLDEDGCATIFLPPGYYDLELRDRNGQPLKKFPVVVPNRPVVD